MDIPRYLAVYFGSYSILGILHPDVKLLMMLDLVVLDLSIGASRYMKYSMRYIDRYTNQYTYMYTSMGMAKGARTQKLCQ